MSFSNVFAVDDPTYADLDFGDEWPEASEFIHDSPQPSNTLLHASTAPAYSSSTLAAGPSTASNRTSQESAERVGGLRSTRLPPSFNNSNSGDDSPPYPDLEFESDEWKENATFVYDSPRSNNAILPSNVESRHSAPAIAPELTTKSNFPHQIDVPQIGAFLPSQQPQMFYAPGQREGSSSSGPIMDGFDSPSLMFGSNVQGFEDTVPTNAVFPGLGAASELNAHDGFAANNLINTIHSPTSSTVSDPRPQYPCRLEVKLAQDKIRVETQNPTRLILYDAPRYINKLHLPSHTIFKPSNQVKADQENLPDTLELSTMVFSATAMQREGLMEQAFLRAASGEVPIGGDETRQAGSKKMEDENDPNLPINGAPLAICNHCMKRERKRAARGKNKHIEEDGDWLKDEAKRIIIFNCKEVVDWCVPGSDRTPVKNDLNSSNVMEVSLPMRIACYCRHQGEKIGFRVVFTVKTQDDQILAQAMSDPMMITDDHKQPTQGGTRPNTARGQPGEEEALTQALIDSFGGESKVLQHFNKSWSTNDLGKLAASRRPTATFGRHHSGDSESAFSTAAPTPRNLSRPASPTSPTGHSQKKRRSAGGDKSKLLSGLRMTQMDGSSRPVSSAKWNNGPASAGHAAPDFSFPDSGMNTALFGSNDGYPTNQMAALDPFRKSEPPTPMAMEQPGASHSNFSGFFGSAHLSPEAAADYANIVPPGYNPSNPPMIQRVIPHFGPMSGGTEVAIMGKSFFQGLDPVFGGIPATQPQYWSPSTLVCHTPPANSPGAVPVSFGFQQELDRRNIGPPHGRPVLFTYQSDAERLRALQPQLPQQYPPDQTMFEPDVAMQGFMRNGGGS